LILRISFHATAAGLSFSEGSLAILTVFFIGALNNPASDVAFLHGITRNVCGQITWQVAASREPAAAVAAADRSDFRISIGFLDFSHFTHVSSACDL
jgi:hypothetical protein